MNFPSYFELFKLHNFFLFTGPLLLGIAANLWRRIYSIHPEKVDHTTKTNTQNPVVVAMACTLIGLVHFYGTYSSVWNAILFRSVNISQIASFTITQLDSEYESGNHKQVTIMNPELIRKGIGYLSTASSRSRSHESYSDGYRIKLLMSNSGYISNYYITVFRKGSGNGQVFVVIPSLSEKISGTVNNAGEYNCEGFIKWINEYIEPLYRSSNN